MKRLLLLSLLLLTTLGGAKDTNFLITTGTTIQDGIDHWAYLVWDRAQSTTVTGKTYAVYGKNGQPADPGSYSRLGVVTPVVSAEIFAPILKRAEGALNDDLRILDLLLDGMVDHLDLLLNHVPDVQRPSVPRTTPIAEKLRQVLVQASQHPQMLEGLHALKARHPAMALCLGIGWAGRMSSQVMTFELREFDLALNADIAVVGRVTLDYTVPPALVAPGKPVWVPNDTPEGDLNIRLRWAVPDELRRLGPQVQGYNVYRTPWSHARDDLGWHVTPPTLAELKADSQTRLVSKENFVLSTHKPSPVIIPGLSPIPQLSQILTEPVPVFTNKFFSEFDVTDLNSDPSTFFFVDDNRRYEDLLPGPPFADQAEYGYIVVARDLLGREGPPSAAGYAVACRTMPPDVPGFVKVAPVFNFDAGNSLQKLRISWKANTNAGSNSRTNSYQILRTRSIGDFRGNNGRPWDHIILATPEITHTADGIEMSFVDDTVEGAFQPGQTIAYAVRALRDPAGPCGPFYSDPSPPAFGTLRDFQGPAAPTGGVQQHCTAPYVGHPDDEAIGPAPADGLRHYFIECERQDRQISSVIFAVIDNTNFSVVTPPGQINQAFEGNKNRVGFEFTHPTGNISVMAVVYGSDGSVSWPYVWDLTTLGSGYATNILHGTFYARSIDPCSKRRGEPVAQLSYGRVIHPTNANSAEYMGQNYVFLQQTSSYVFNPGAIVSVGLVLPNGAVSPFLFGLATSGDTVQFIDQAAVGLTPAQLMTRYRIYTFDRSENIQVTETTTPPAASGAKRLEFPHGWGAPPGTQVCISRRNGGAVVGPAVVKADGKILIQDPTAPADTLYHADLFLGPMISGTCKHQPVAIDSDLGLVKVPVIINLQPAAESVEYRIYRRVEEGPLSLIAQGNTEFDGAQVKEIIRSDDSMPAVNCVIRYYGQTLDKNGNPSALALLDTIKLGVSEATPLPTPMMMAPKLTPIANTDQSTFRLEWFCSTAGVDRFRVYLKSNKGPTSYENGGGININTSIPFTDPVTGETTDIYDVSGFLTKRVGSAGFTGPAFSYEITVDNGAKYYAAVEALAPEKFDSEGFDKTPHGERSLFVTETAPLAPVVIPDSVVPWPARPIPETEINTNVQAEIHELGNTPLPTTLLPDKLYYVDGAQRSTVGVKIGSWFATRSGQFFGNPNDVLFSIPAHDALPTIKTLPAVLYRQQVRSAGSGIAPPAEQGPVVQCSPLITEIGYHVNGTGENVEGMSIVKDPAIGFKNTNYQPGLDIITFHLMDKLPVTQGATYRYWLIHFNNKNEPDRSFYAGEVTIP